MPYMNAYPFLNDPALLDVGRALSLEAIERADCVIDAVGAPFFAFGAETSLTAVYPATAMALDDFRVATGLVDCDVCTVYVRR